VLKSGRWFYRHRITPLNVFGNRQRPRDQVSVTARAREAVALYKRIRPVLAEADCYHLTPPPDPDRPRGWMALQYVAPDHRRGVLMAYRLAEGEPERRFRLRGLDPDLTYRVRAEGRPAETLTGRELAGPGLSVRLGAEWRANVVELEAVNYPL
jgi:alpha-galactosidase